MKKVYKLLATIFIIIIIFVNFALVIFRNEIIAYLDNINNLNVDFMQTPAAILNGPQDKGIIDLSLFDNAKFRKLKKIEVDYSGILTAATSTKPGVDTATSTKPQFRVGNPSPFIPF